MTYAINKPIRAQRRLSSADDSRRLFPLVADLNVRHPELVKRTQYLSADKGYDSEANNCEGFERRYIRGMKKMQVRAGLALLAVRGLPGNLENPTRILDKRGQQPIIDFEAVSLVRPPCPIIGYCPHLSFIVVFLSVTEHFQFHAPFA